MKKYDSYKNSGIDWIGEIPEHWRLTRLKYYLSIQSGKGITNEQFIENGEYSIYGGNGILGFTNNYSHDSLDLVIGRVGALCGNIRLVGGKKWISDNALVANTTENYYFFEAILKVLDLNKLANKNAQPLITGTMVKEQYISLPPIEEQTKIANYLDHKTTQIDTLISKKQQFINLLQEERVAVINQTVTKGLDPNVPMKDSGVEWLGEIPEHWEVKKLKYLVICNRNTLSENSEPTQIINYIEIGDVNFEKGITGYTEYSFEKAPSRARRIVHSEDVIVSTVRTYLKAIATIKEEYDGFIASTGFAVLTPKEIYFKFLSYLVLTNGFIDSVISLSKGVSYPSITSQDLLNISICLPNNIEEQHAISCHLDIKISEIDKIITKSHQEIELLKEYKTALISEVVTGKVDVRDEVIKTFNHA
jgi:type I restriction enzyme S subunit